MQPNKKTKYSITVDSTNIYFQIIDTFCGKKLKGKDTCNLSFVQYDDEICSETGEEIIKPVYSIIYGESELEFEGETIYVTKRRIGDTKGTSQKVDVFREIVFGTNHSFELLDNFFKAVYEDNQIKPKKDKINIFKWGTYWSKLSSLEKRPLDTIYLDDQIMDEILKDIKSFQKDKEIYKKYGIPYKRNYLFSGLPGTGKTSFIFSLASEIDYSIYMIPFTLEIDDNIFTSALKGIDKNSILVLEDVDALFVRRDTQSKSSLSFSGLINILDGLARKEGLIVFLTTNHLEKLDSALIRPGRIDKYIEFTCASEQQIRKMFKKFLPDQVENVDKFFYKIEGIKTTTAILQKFFFENRNEKNICSNKIIKKLRELCSSYVKDDADKLNSMYN